MNLSNTHKLVTIPSDTLLDPHRDDDKRDVLLNLHSLGNPSDIIWIGVSSESKVRAMRSGRMFSLELPLSKLLAGDTVSVESEGKQSSMVVISTSALLKVAAP